MVSLLLLEWVRHSNWWFTSITARSKYFSEQFFRPLIFMLLVSHSNFDLQRYCCVAWDFVWKMSAEKHNARMMPSLSKMAFKKRQKLMTFFMRYEKKEEKKNFAVSRWSYGSDESDSVEFVSVRWKCVWFHHLSLEHEKKKREKVQFPMEVCGKNGTLWLRSEIFECFAMFRCHSDFYLRDSWAEQVPSEIRHGKLQFKVTRQLLSDESWQKKSFMTRKIYSLGPV
jgi:hypothetical protein